MVSPITSGGVPAVAIAPRIAIRLRRVVGPRVRHERLHHRDHPDQRFVPWGSRSAAAPHHRPKLNAAAWSHSLGGGVPFAVVAPVPGATMLPSHRSPLRS